MGLRILPIGGYNLRFYATNVFLVRLQNDRSEELEVLEPVQIGYSWIARPVQLHKKSICQNSERVTKDPRPPLESS